MITLFYKIVHYKPQDASEVSRRFRNIPPLYIPTNSAILALLSIKYEKSHGQIETFGGKYEKFNQKVFFNIYYDIDYL